MFIYIVGFGQYRYWVLNSSRTNDYHQSYLLSYSRTVLEAYTVSKKTKTYDFPA